MAFPEQIERLVTKLTELTEQGKVDWQASVNVNAFLATVGDFVVTVTRGGSELYGGYSFQIIGKEGRIIDGSIANFIGPEKDQDGNKNWQRLGHLHELARRSALKADQAVSELLSSLEKIA
jgi:hypothetical protein